MNFESSMKRHNFRSEVMSFANLVQNQTMIYQNSEMIQAQHQTNTILTRNELIRQKEKQIDIWMEEFKFQGMSPIEAHRQALAEWEINELKLLAQKYSGEYQYLLNNSIEIVREQVANKPIRKALLRNWSKKLTSISEDSEEVFMYESLVQQNFKDKMLDLNNLLTSLPHSKLDDGSEFRQSVNTLVTTPSNLEIFEEASKVLDEFIDEFNALENLWRQETASIKDFNSRFKEQSTEIGEQHESIKRFFGLLEKKLEEFSGSLTSLIRSNNLYQDFEQNIKSPFERLANQIKEFQSKINAL
jgi:hypothetical protein